MSREKILENELHVWILKCISYGAGSESDLFYLIKICVASMVYHKQFKGGGVMKRYISDI